MNEIFSQVAEHAKECAPRECCGCFVDGQTEIFRSKNHSPPNSKDTYIMDHDVVIRAEDLGGPAFYYHSHVDGSVEPSEIDQVSCNSFQVPFLIYSLRDNAFQMIDPVPSWKPLLGTQWAKEGSDCLDLVEEYFSLVHGIKLEHVDRPESYEFREDPFDHQCGAMGFRRLDVWQGERKSDVFTFRLRSDTANHVGIVVGVGDQFLHRPINELAFLSDLNRAWRRRIVHRYRHRRF